ncbi:MAG: anti-sigma regulatory factor [Pyrinomonadaceae bacterium]|nr:anti-sigma regulatory factor [Sphingobacteriaceae bacterium]
MITLSRDLMPIQKDQDVVPFRNRVREYAVKMKMGLVNQTKLITAASELVRNMLKYGNGGEALIEVVTEVRDTGVRLTFKDQGPGIEDLSLAMKDGYSTTRSLGLGLPGTKRLVNVFNIDTELGKGTTVIIIKWVNG